MSMRNAESVTFGGSGLNRAAALRADARQIARLAEAPGARAVAVWRGKLLVSGAGAVGLARLPMDHPLFSRATGASVLLGLEGEDAVFARDISAWAPEDEPDTLGAFFDPSEQRHPELPADHRFCDFRAVMAALGARDAKLAATARAILGWHETHRFCANCGRPTEVAMGGWQRACPACGRRHFPRTDPVVIMLITHGNAVLMGRSHGWPEGMHSLLAGFVEPGETIEAAVRREVAEEAGVAVGTVSYLASQPWPWPSSLMIGCRGEAAGRDLVIDETEIEEALWLSREELLAVFAGENHRLQPAREGSIAHFLLKNWLADRLD